MARKKYDWNNAVLLIVVFGAIYYITTLFRASYGWFENGTFIAINSIAWILFFGVVTGVVVSAIVSKLKR